MVLIVGSASSSDNAIYTIGYGARSLEVFIKLLKKYEIKYVIDIRSKPYSRYKPEFSKFVLDASLDQNNIRYVYMGDLLGGRPDDPDCYDDEGKVDYERLKRKDFYRQGIKRLQKAASLDERVVLMCSEGKPERCHRSKLIGKTLAELNIPVLHIDENGELITQEVIITRWNNGMQLLVDNEGRQIFDSAELVPTTSRKKYR